MPAERRRGPAAMGHAELQVWMAGRPRGALCVLTADGRLQATPATVDGTNPLTGHVRALVPEGWVVEHDRPVCLVADQFESYEGIRGVIVQGRVATGTAAATGGASTGVADLVAVSVDRVTTFSFAPPTADPGASGA